ncbi:hypothetical protein [Kingella oralis]|uniref:hypothetical protein n=1 Tax=Kingella oralis TaxID=505 RepID=UPI0034E5E903
MLIFCSRRRFAAYHEQGQAPAPHAQTFSGCLTPIPAPNPSMAHRRHADISANQ